MNDESAPESLTAQLKDTERTLALLVRGVRDYGIFMLDPKGQVATWNEGAERIYGFAASEAIGKHFSIFYTPEELQTRHPQQELENAKNSERYEDEGWRLRKDGTRFWADVVITPVYDENRQFVGFASVIRDLTERKQNELLLENERREAAKSQEHFRLMITSVRDYAIFMLDPQGHVATWNEGAQRIKGYTASEIIGRHFSVFYTPEAQQNKHPEHELEVAKEEGRYEEEGWRIRKDGSMFWANVVITSLFDEGELVGFAKVTRDLTERRKSEQVREENSRLIDETNQELQRLAYVVSHELQAPIATITRYGNLFSVRYKHVLGPDAYEFLDKMGEATRLIARIVDDLWTYARVSKPNAVFELVYTGHCINDAINELGEVVSDADITTGNLPSLEANRQQLTFVFKELIKNAIRYRSTDRPKIHIEAKEHDKGWLFSIRDNGIGIDKIHSLEVFQLFHRLRGGPEPAATGMGLAICKKIVQQHNGHMWYESRPGTGTTFFMHLPEQDSRPHPERSYLLH